MKRKAKEVDTRNGAEAIIESVIDQFYGGDDFDDPWTKEPIPDWCQNVVARFGRVFAPQFTVEDFRNHKPRFLGYMVAFMEGVVLQAESAPSGRKVKNEFARNLNALVREVAKSGPDLVQAVISAAGGMEAGKRSEFFRAYADGFERGVALQATQRMKDSNTAKMCFFLLMVRPFIDAKSVKSVAEMFKTYCIVHAAFGRPAAPTEMAMASLKTQFSSLCVECGLKIRGKGRPKSK